ncbi:MAG TPA: lysophospholipid acyltransferase family protein [Microlunatus sp.]
MLYWIFKWVFFDAGVRLLWGTRIEGHEHIPVSGPAILVGNHISSADTFLLPAMMKRRLTFPAKAELFAGRGPGARFISWFLKSVGQLPMDRSGGRASASSMDGVLAVLRHGELLGIFPEGTRSPDGRLYKGKTGVARLVLQADVPVVPVGFVDTEWVRSRLGIPWLRRPVIKIGPPLDFSAYAAAATDRDVLRWVTDEIMAAVQQLSGQEYVDAYGASVKSALAEGRTFPAAVHSRPGDGRPVPSQPGG